MRHFHLALLAFAAGCFSGHAADYRVSSPSGNIVLTVSNGDRLSYSVTWNGRTALAPSAMGFEFKGEKPMAGPFTVLGNPAVEAHVEAWKPVVANKYSDISVASKNLTLQLKETADEGRRMDLVRGRTEQFREKEGLRGPGLPPRGHPHGHGLDGRQENRQGPEDPGKESLEILPGQAAGDHDGIRRRVCADGGIKFVQTFVLFRILPYLCGRKRIIKPIKI